MRRRTFIPFFAATLGLCFQPLLAEEEEGFTALFDGSTLEGWKVSENPETFSVEDGAIVARGDRAHAFYVGGENEGKFKDFELRMEVLTEPNANGGIFIHSAWVDGGWPPQGYEVQVNNTQGDWRKSGGLYGVVDNREPFEDNVWMTYVIRVEDGVITTKVGDRVVVDAYTAPEGESRLQEEGGLIALQAHDPGSIVHYKNIRIKTLD